MLDPGYETLDILRHKSGLRRLFCCHRPKNNGKPGGWAGLSYAPHARVWIRLQNTAVGLSISKVSCQPTPLCAPPTSLPSALQDTFRLNTQFMRPPNVKQGQLRGKRANARRLACLRKERMCATQPVANFNAPQTARQVKAAAAVALSARGPSLLTKNVLHSFELKTNQRTVADWMADWVVPPFHVLRSRSGNGGRGPKFPL